MHRGKYRRQGILLEPDQLDGAVEVQNVVAVPRAYGVGRAFDDEDGTWACVQMRM